MLSDTELERLLGEAAGSFAVPDPELAAPAPAKRVWQRRWPQVSAAAAVLVVGTLLLSGGGGGGSTLMSRDGFKAAEGSADGALDSGAGGGTTGGTGGAVAAPGAGAAPRAPATVGGNVPAGLSAAVEPDAARVVKTGELSLVVDEGRVSATVQRLQVIVAGVRGYVADSTSSEAGERPSASITVRVPVASFDAVRAKVRALPVKVVSETASGKDVTASYADTQAQIQSLKAARARYLAILGGAKTIAETLTVQQRVDEVQQQIDRLEGQRRVLADQSDYGTLSFTVAETADELLATSAPSGWSKAWDDAKHGFSSGVQSLIAHSGRTLLVLLVGAALLLLGRAGWRLARRRLV